MLPGLETNFTMAKLTWTNKRRIAKLRQTLR